MPEGVWLYIWLGLSALAAGAVNSIAGGGTLLTFPALLSAVPPVVANGTSTVALVPGSFSAAWGFRGELQHARRWLALLIWPSVAGGLVGSLLLTCLDPHYFDALIPWLILTAAVLFLLQPLLARRLISVSTAKPAIWTIIGVVVFQFLVSVYGGYFGAGIGILMLSSLGLIGVGDIHTMNALKNFLAVCINGITVVVLVFKDVISWRYAVVMAPAAILGAYTGARLSQRLDRRVVRWMVVAIGFGLAAHFFYQRFV
jgi:uncharacterized membrane protein YfcA